MRYAIATDGDQVAPHFGRCERYEILDIENEQVVARKQMECPAHEPGLLPRLLKEQGAQVVICGGAGANAVNLFAASGVGMFLGVSGSLDQVVAAIIAGELVGGDSMCEH